METANDVLRKIPAGRDRIKFLYDLPRATWESCDLPRGFRAVITYQGVTYKSAVYAKTKALGVELKLAQAITAKHFEEPHNLVHFEGVFYQPGLN